MENDICGNIIIKSPFSREEFQSMWQLNHAVFSCEYPQHPKTTDGCLVDKFHSKNIYRIAWDGRQVVGMISGHWQPPFSAVAKFGSRLEDQLIDGKTAEIRLLALRNDHRGGMLAVRLGGSLMEELVCHGMECLVISGISLQVKFYQNIGFRVVGDPVWENGIAFYPMLGNLSEILARNKDVTWRFAKKHLPQNYI